MPDLSEDGPSDCPTFSDEPGLSENVLVGSYFRQIRSKRLGKQFSVRLSFSKIWSSRGR